MAHWDELIAWAVAEVKWLFVEVPGTCRVSNLLVEFV